MNPTAARRSFGVSWVERMCKLRFEKTLARRQWHPVRLSRRSLAVGKYRRVDTRGSPVCLTRRKKRRGLTSEIAFRAIRAHARRTLGVRWKVASEIGDAGGRRRRSGMPVPNLRRELFRSIGGHAVFGNVEAALLFIGRDPEHAGSLEDGEEEKHRPEGP